jgi:hypothetical protein
VREAGAKLVLANEHITAQKSELADVKRRISSLEQDLEQLEIAKVEDENALRRNHDLAIRRMADEMALARELQHTRVRL